MNPNYSIPEKFKQRESYYSGSYINALLRLAKSDLTVEYLVENKEQVMKKKSKPKAKPKPKK